MLRVGVIGIVIRGGNSIAVPLQAVLSEYADIITGRQGVPDKVHGINCISLIVAGEVERVSALTSRLGLLRGEGADIQVKSVLMPAQ